MNRLLEWLFDLDQIHLGVDQPLTVQWHAPYARWVLFGSCFLLGLFIIFTYRRETGGVARKAAPLFFRIAALTVVVAMIGRPVLVFQRNRVEPARVALLIDTSSSMAQAESYPDPQLGDTMRRGAGLTGTAELNRAARLDLVRSALVAHEVAALRALAGANDLTVTTFASVAEPLARINVGGATAEAQTAIDGLIATGAATRLAACLTDVLNEDAGPLAAVVVISDGQDTAGGAIAEVIDRARARLIPIHTVAVGSPHPRCDIAVGRLMTDANVFLGDFLSVRAELRAGGLAEPRPVIVRLLDGDTDTALATTTVELGGAVERVEVELTALPERVGPLPLRVSVEPIAGETILDNNVTAGEAYVLGDRLRVLYVEGYPRFEYRYLKNAFVRENSIRLSSLLLSADADFAQEGTEPVRRFPETPEEFQEFDVIILGDVDPRGHWVSDAQMHMLVDFVGRHGGGFALLAGERHAPHDFRDTPLERLLPVRLDPGAGGGERTAITQGFYPRLTPEGESSRMFRFAAARDRGRAIFDALPPLYWTARTLGVKPGAEVLCEHPTREDAGAPAPVIVLGRYGAGRTFFQGTDDTWRWRRQTGELVFDAYWVQVARALAPPRHLGEDERIVIRLDPPVCRGGERVDVRLKVLDSRALASMGPTAEVSLRDSNGFVVQRIPLEALGQDAAGVFEGSFVAGPAGRFALSADDFAPLPGRRPAQAALLVAHADLEALQPHADHDTLRRLAEGTGGHVVPLDRMAEMFASIEDRGTRIPDDISEPLWDTKLALILFMFFVSAEWIVRKVTGLQ